MRWERVRRKIVPLWVTIPFMWLGFAALIAMPFLITRTVHLHWADLESAVFGMVIAGAVVYVRYQSVLVERTADSWTITVVRRRYQRGSRGRRSRRETWLIVFVAVLWLGVLISLAHHSGADSGFFVLSISVFVAWFAYRRGKRSDPATPVAVSRPTTTHTAEVEVSSAPATPEITTAYEHALETAPSEPGFPRRP